VSNLLSFGIAIPAYRNPQRLRNCLNSIQQIAPDLLNRTTVVDDSGDGMVAKQLSPEFPSVRWIVHEQNLGFGKSSNDAVTNCETDIVILLNDDTELAALSTESLTALFADETTFAVTFQSVDDDGHFREGAKRLSWSLGFPRVLHNPKDQRQDSAGRWISDYAVGGHAAFRRDYFLKLTGFDSLFDPFYWEDVDLSARAREKGWKSFYSKQCIVKHGAGGAIKSNHDLNFIEETTLRNRILFARRHADAFSRRILPVSVQLLKLQSFILGDGNFGRALKAANDRDIALVINEP
jgi:GT2 family glycosyltransferase